MKTKSFVLIGAMALLTTVSCRSVKEVSNKSLDLSNLTTVESKLDSGVMTRQIDWTSQERSKKVVKETMDEKGNVTLRETIVYEDNLIKDRTLETETKVGDEMKVTDQTNIKSDENVNIKKKVDGGTKLLWFISIVAIIAVLVVLLDLFGKWRLF